MPGKRVEAGETFAFDCRSGLACFNLCCRNLNLMLYPYDVIRLKQCLGISSEQFLDEYVDIVLRPGAYFPEVLLSMAENEFRTCKFLTDAGCSVYPDRPDACRKFPIEQGVIFDDRMKIRQVFHLFRPPEFCLGRHEGVVHTPESWIKNQNAEKHDQMTLKWGEIRHLFQVDPWQGQGPDGQKGKMAFMATYNMDAFRVFVLESSFLKRFKIKPEVIRRIRKDDTALLKLGFEWIRLYLWGIPSPLIRIR